MQQGRYEFNVTNCYIYIDITRQSKAFRYQGVSDCNELFYFLNCSYKHSMQMLVFYSNKFHSYEIYE